MMKQRRRMLSLTNNFDAIFTNAQYITSSGINAETASYAQISQSSLESNKIYYLFAYCEKNFSIFKYYNGTIISLYERNPTSTYLISLVIDSGYVKLKTGTSFTRRCHGITALQFDISMDSYFLNLNFIASDGLNTAGSAYYWAMTISTFYQEESTYLFVGCAEKFCIYKLSGILYQDLVLLFSHNLYLKNYNTSTNTQFVIGSTPTSVIYGFGSTAISFKRR